MYLDHSMIEALHSVLPHWYDLEELTLKDCIFDGSCMLLEAIARHTAHPYRLKKISIEFCSRFEELSIFGAAHSLMSQLAKYVTKSNPMDLIKLFNVCDAENSAASWVQAHGTVFCKNFEVESDFICDSFNNLLISQISENTALEQLTLVSAFALRSASVAHRLFVALRNREANNLQSLCLSDMRIREVGFQELTAALPKLPHLQELRMDSSLHSDACHMIAEPAFLSAVQQLPKLHLLELGLNHLCGHGTTLLMSLVDADGCATTQLHMLKLNNTAMPIEKLIDAIDVVYRRRKYKQGKLLDIVKFGGLYFCKVDDYRLCSARKKLSTMVDVTDFAQSPCVCCIIECSDHVSVM